MDQSQLTRLIQAIKGTGRFADPKARVVVSTATTRELLSSTSLGEIGSVNARYSTNGALSTMSITDSSGNLYVLLDVQGAADGATLS